MAENITGNVLILQSGKSTTTSNASLAGVVTEALNHEDIEEIYGCLNGISGLLNEQIIDMAEQSQQTIRSLHHTPGCALGSNEYSLKTEADRDRAFEVLGAHDIHFLFVIGDSCAMNEAHKFTQIATEKNYPLNVIGIPNSPDNDMPVTDHCPGYGSAAKYIASTVKQLAHDINSHGKQNPIVILELNEASSSWLVASSALAKRRNHPEDAPHLVYMPETAFTDEAFIESVQKTLTTNGNCFIVTGETLINSDGNFIATNLPNNVKAKPVSEHLSALLTDNFTDNIYITKLGHLPQTAIQTISGTDNEESFNVAQKAVQVAIEGESGKMITLQRGDTDKYSLETGLIALEKIATEVKSFPANWIDADNSISPQFFKYALPFIQDEITVSFDNGLPLLAELNKRTISKKLTSHIASPTTPIEPKEEAPTTVEEKTETTPVTPMASATPPALPKVSTSEETTPATE